PLEANDLQSLENYRKLGRAKLKLEEYGPNPGDIVQTLESRVDTWRQMAEADLTFYDRMPPTGAAAGAIGVHWADQFVRQFGWEWACLVIDNNQESPSISVVSPDRAYALHPVSFVYLLLTLPHLDNTLLLIFNM